jgi:hypothetical protein
MFIDLVTRLFGAEPAPEVAGVVNIFCPTGAGGGINPSCSPKGVRHGPDTGATGGGGGGGRDRPKLSAVQKKILDKYDDVMTKRTADYYRTKAADEASFGFKIVPPSGVFAHELPYKRLRDLEDLRDKGIISMTDKGSYTIVSRLDKPPGYYDPPEIPGM